MHRRNAVRRALIVIFGLLVSQMAAAGQITMTDPQQDTTENGKTLCTYENSIYLFTYVTKGKCPYAKTFDTVDSE
ncbi:hypothetical protein I5462_04280 [Citrobacter freundii]|uniref:hypothetical protein n=1 Tax=Enterobacteriaceae TaxID=543 RepID=UPI00061AEFCF|nr:MULTISPECIES: hypothetical protein [Enterobacteriaceae]ELT9726135.1 hypothetical protein [Klebsiella michiganensis]KAE9750910.1 hypothetical protein GP702_03855 [Enterobacteriaceae bacterium TzEc058]KKC62364.1 hypothetical protein WG82_17680 [Citrobacter amalonaticus]MBJ4956422.1 hypothetical protein [Salmonella enterica subsp. enterica serovar Goldcoast]MDU1182724.1 hypothetical protein [Citrobacter sp.]PZR27906.1 MAG: hypothetical protein DI538_25285 [Azospira oryzae]RRN88586.1 hypothet